MRLSLRLNYVVYLFPFFGNNMGIYALWANKSKQVFSRVLRKRIRVEHSPVVKHLPSMQIKQSLHLITGTKKKRKRKKVIIDGAKSNHKVTITNKRPTNYIYMPVMVTEEKLEKYKPCTVTVNCMRGCSLVFVRTHRQQAYTVFIPSVVISEKKPSSRRWGSVELWGVVLESLENKRR